MPEIKVQCDCGQRYKFDVEPVNGQMPFTVTCPVCGMDGTGKANSILNELAYAPPPVSIAPLPTSIAPPPPPRATTPIVLRPMPAAAPAPFAPAPALAPAVAPTAPVPPPVPVPMMASAVAAPVGAPSIGPSEKPRLRISKTAHEEAPALAPMVSAAAPPAAPPVSRPGRPISRPVGITPEPERKGNFGLGVLGAFAGAALGALGYFLIFRYTDFRIGLMAIAVGFLVGLGARLLGKVGSMELGVISGTLTIVAVVGATYWTALSFIRDELSEWTQMSGYEQKVKEAKEVMARLPNVSDNEIRVYLAKLEADIGESGSPSSITADQIKAFRELELPEIQGLANGTITKQQYEEKHKEEIEDMKKLQQEGEDTVKGWFFILLLHKGTLVSIAAGTGLAFKMSTDA